MKSLDIHPYYNRFWSIGIFVGIFAYRKVLFTVAALDLDLRFKIQRTIRRTNEKP